MHRVLETAKEPWPMLRCDWRSIAITFASSLKLNFDSHSKTLSYVDLLICCQKNISVASNGTHGLSSILLWSKSGNGSSGFDISSRECTSCEIKSRREIEALRSSKYGFQSATDKLEQGNDKKCINVTYCNSYSSNSPSIH